MSICAQILLQDIKREIWKNTKDALRNQKWKDALLLWNTAEDKYLKKKKFL